VIKRHYQAIVVAGGLVLIAMGIVIWTGELNRLNTEVVNWMEETGFDFYNF